MIATRIVEGLGSVAWAFEAFVVDQWGVLHDGRKPYPGAIEALKKIREMGRRVVILSNSGRRARPNVERLARHGITADLYDAVVSSGEVAWEGLALRNHAPWNGLGMRALLISRGGDRSLVDGTGIEVTDDIAEADFVLLAGGRDGWTRLEDYTPVMAEALNRGLTLVCANPDHASIGVHGLEIGPGAVAEAYAAVGGATHFVGKPRPEVYDACLARLPGLSPSRILAIGDSLAHDVRGAKNRGLRAMLVATGVSAPHFAGADIAFERLEALVATEDVVPDFFVPTFQW